MKKFLLWVLQSLVLLVVTVVTLGLVLEYDLLPPPDGLRGLRIEFEWAIVVYIGIALAWSFVFSCIATAFYMWRHRHAES